MIASHWSEQRFCPHTDTQPMRYLCSNGVVQIKATCTTCGLAVGITEPHADHPNRASYPQVQRHPDPCDCHPARSGKDALRELNDVVNDTTRSTIDRREAYDEYLRSAEWKERRAYMVGRALNRCELCSTPGGPNGAGLHVHHRTYVRLGREFDADLIVLCEACHHDHHDRLQRRRAVRQDMRDAA